nr:hypothetical protein [Tanacetum cinerariifolium]
MTTPTFAKTHNLISYLEKPDESDGFEQIIDFLNGSSIRYALTASPTIRTSCIMLFWSMAKVKPVNDVVRVQALIDGKRVNIKESSIHRTLKLDDEKGISCLANDEIFTGLANMGYEKMYDKLTFYKAFFSPQWKFIIHTILQCHSAKTACWNELSSTIASVIICLASHQKFKFLRYILLSLVKNIEAGVPFYMFPRFVQLLVDYQLGDMSHHQDIHDNPSLTKKVFTNIKMPKLKKQHPIAPKIPSLEPSPVHQLPSPFNDPIPDANKDNLKFQELMDLYTRLSNKVLDLKSEVIKIKSSFIARIQKLEDRVDQLEAENKALKEKSFKTTQVDTAAPVENMEKSFKQGRMIADIDEDVEDIDEEESAEVEEVLKVVTAAKLITDVVTTAAQVSKSKDKGKRILIEEPKPLKGQAQIDTDEAFARQLEAELNANVNWNDVIEQVKRSKRQDNTVMREDLETLWKLVKERFKTTEPKNFSDDFLLNILKIMFEKPNVEANMILLVEKKYPLTHFTIQQMLDNVRLEVEKESKMSLELLRLVRGQLNEGYVPK